MKLYQLGRDGKPVREITAHDLAQACYQVFRPEQFQGFLERLELFGMLNDPAGHPHFPGDPEENSTPE